LSIVRTYTIVNTQNSSETTVTIIINFMYIMGTSVTN